jgi:hypothetical protein
MRSSDQGDYNITYEKIEFYKSGLVCATAESVLDSGKCSAGAIFRLHFWGHLSSL